jgi:hypothetical protein
MATYFWVGGNGTWNNTFTSNWASSSGGPGGAGRPTSADNAYFDSNSGSPTVTIASTATCNTLIVFSGGNPTFTLSANVTFPSSTSIFLRGTLNLNNYVFSAGDLNFLTSPSVSVAFGTSGRIEIAENPGSLSMQDATGFSYTGTFDIRFTSSPSGSTTRNVFLGTNASGYWTESTVVDIGASKVPGISLGTTATNNLNVAGYFKNVDFTGVNGTSTGTGAVYVYGDLTFATGHTGGGYPNTYYMHKTSGTQVLTSSGNTINASIYTANASARTLQLNGDFTFSNGTSIIFSNSAGTLDLNGSTLTVGNLFLAGLGANATLAFNGGNVVLPYNTTFFSTQFEFAFTGTFDVSLDPPGPAATTNIEFRSTSFTEANALSIGVNAATNTVLVNNYSNLEDITIYGKVRNIDLAGWNGMLSKTNQTVTIYGNLTLGASALVVGTGATALTFAATSGTQVVTTNGASVDCPVAVAAPGATVRFSGSALINGAFTFSDGTVELTSGQTTTVVSFTTTGTTLKYLQSTTPGSQATLSDFSGANTVTYLSIKDNAATTSGSATWNATSVTNINAGNVTGWNFGAPANTFFLL